MSWFFDTSEEDNFLPSSASTPPPYHRKSFHPANSSNHSPATCASASVILMDVNTTIVTLHRKQLTPWTVWWTTLSIIVQCSGDKCDKCWWFLLQQVWCGCDDDDELAFTIYQLLSQSLVSSEKNLIDLAGINFTKLIILHTKRSLKQILSHRKLFPNTVSLSLLKTAMKFSKVEADASSHVELTIIIQLSTHHWEGRTAPLCHSVLNC